MGAMGWLSIAAQGVGTYMNATAASEQGSIGMKDARREIDEIRRQKEYGIKQAQDQLIILEKDKNITKSNYNSDATGKGIVAGTGSSATRRAALAERYNVQQERISEDSAEMQRRADLAMYLIRKKAHHGRTQARWNMWSEIINGVSGMGSTAKDMGLFSKNNNTPNSGNWAGTNTSSSLTSSYGNRTV